uniref:Putative secreted protein n=1 Tax=Ixodes ricinus TaxID=34613 RepID=A0A6B0TZ81_IXORI
MKSICWGPIEVFLVHTAARMASCLILHLYKHMQHVLESDFDWRAGTTYLPSQAEKWQQPCTLLAVMH